MSLEVVNPRKSSLTNGTPEMLVGCLLLHCGGCRAAIADRADRVWSREIQDATAVNKINK
jgi:hypothetical protein